MFILALYFFLILFIFIFFFGRVGGSSSLAWIGVPVQHLSRPAVGIRRPGCGMWLPYRACSSPFIFPTECQLLPAPVLPSREPLLSEAERGDHDACGCMNVCHQILMEASFLTRPQWAALTSCRDMWVCCLLASESALCLNNGASVLGYFILLLLFAPNSAKTRWQFDDWGIVVKVNLFLLKWVIVKIKTNKPELMWGDCSFSALSSCAYELEPREEQTQCHDLAQGFPRLHNPFWPRHQSHILELLSLSGEPSDPGRINEQAYLDVTQHWRRSGLLTEDPRSGLLGKHIRILHEYFHHSVRKITSRSYSQIDFPSFLIQPKYKQWYLLYSLCCQPVEDLFKTACKSA